MGNAQVGPTRNLADAARSVRTFKIDGFSSTSTAPATVASGHDECIVVCSRWSVGWHEWEIRCYPASSVCSMWMSLKLVLLAHPAATGDVVTARLDCWLVDPAGLAEQSEPRTVSAAFARHCGGESAPLVLAHRRDLEISGYLRGDGTLTVKCAITVLREQRPGVDVPASLPVPAPRGAPAERDGIRHHVRCLRRNVCRAAHKVVLAARSPLFMAEFFGDASDKKCARRLEVHGMEAAEFKAMLHFIYTDTTTELDRHDGEESVALTCGLLAAADRTAATILNLAELNNCPRLKASTFCQYDACMAQTYSPLQAPITKVPI
ncbi:BTB/POZ and MATH domain-containing protein 1-like [Triticum aestivum]|uniref:BTB/POZ and MATH domain-containing protein 1-like n=1 Tax=Triticum aestivum TaxID=4565 RepID=UPI001D0267A2|nr:BTB/POZ and MATH domain-containing protein 1-like [Triticum aestivum]